MDAQKILMVGVKDDKFADQVNRGLGGAAAGDRVRRVSELPRLEMATEEQRNELTRFPVAIVHEDQFDNWATWPVGARPPHYILVEAFEPHRQDDGFFGDPGTLGYGTAGQLQVVISDIARMLKGAADDGSGERDCIKVGAYVGGDEKHLRGRFFGGLRCGRTGETLLELRRIGQARRRGEGRIDRARVELFGRRKPREWLDMYVGILSDSEELPPFATAFEYALNARELKKFLGVRSTGLAYRALFTDTFEKMFMDAGGETAAVLVQGETGTGKSIAARELHRLRAQQLGLAEEDLPFRHVNCSGLGTMDSVELFGALEGAYTGSSTTNPGAVFAAFGGTVFLDEFGNLSARSQENLLVFLEDGSMKPMGWSGRSMQVPTMVVAATNERLTDRIAAGEFREDLYRRFRDRVVTLSPLREIKNEELWYFVDYLVQMENRSRDGEAIAEVTKAAFDRLLNHDYPGNVRELEGILAKAVRRAREARRCRIVRSDVEFEASTLPSVDVVAAVIGDGQGRVLLRWSSAWARWFFPARIVGGERVAKCLEEELRDKFQVAEDHWERLDILKPAARFGAPRRGLPSFKLIQYSRRDGKTRHYHFYLYKVVLKAEGLEELRRRLDIWGDCVWADEDALSGREMGEVSDSVQQLRRQLPGPLAAVSTGLR